MGYHTNKKTNSGRELLNSMSVGIHSLSEIENSRLQAQGTMKYLEEKQSNNLNGKREPKVQVVKYMSSVPFYLQQDKKRGNIQEKVLNYGVLEWGLLEKWKYKQSKVVSKRISRPYLVNSSIPDFEMSARLERTPTKNSSSKEDCFKKSHEELMIHNPHSNLFGSRRDSQTLRISKVQNNEISLPNSREKMPSLNIKETNKSERNIGPEINTFSGACTGVMKKMIQEPDLKFLNSTPVSLKIKAQTQVDSVLLHVSEEEKGSYNKGCSSLKRMLDPLLKPIAIRCIQIPESPTFSLVDQGTQNKEELTNPKLDDLYSASGSFSSCASTTADSNPVFFRAILRCTRKQELPLYIFTINEQNALVATTGKVGTFPKDCDKECDYSFYSINTLKQKCGSWILQGSKVRKHGVFYKHEGNMKVSCNFKERCKVKEFVLYGSNIKPGVQQTVHNVNNECAAIVVKFQRESLRDRCSSETESLKSLFEEEKGWNGSRQSSKVERISKVIVILPNGTHGAPGKGVPSPLIKRWSTGLCDCGGWDEGCKLMVFNSKDKEIKLSCPSAKCNEANENQVEIFEQRGSQEGKVIFSMRKLKGGLYTIDFNAPISSLQAFSICVAILHGQNLDLENVHNLTKTENSHKQKSTEDEVRENFSKTSYGIYPPSSPVGRV